MTGVTLRGLSVAYDGLAVVDRISLDVPSGTWLGLIGPNGAGKTTLLRATAGLVPHQGTVAVGGDEARSLSRRSLARAIAYVPQRPSIPAGLGVADYVLLGRTPHISYFGSEGRRDLSLVRDVLERLDIGHLAGRALGTLSGGEVQRAILGRALAQEAPVLLLDEPTSALDVGHQQEVLELLDELRQERKLTVITAMHDLTLAGQFAEELVLMDRGRIVIGGPAAEVLTEDAIRLHYGASVRVLRDGEGIAVVPRRSGRAAE
jgi:iron complex transport system ATP-binding protein